MQVLHKDLTRKIRTLRVRSRVTTTVEVLLTLIMDSIMPTRIKLVELDDRAGYPLASMYTIETDMVLQRRGLSRLQPRKSRSYWRLSKRLSPNTQRRSSRYNTNCRCSPRRTLKGQGSTDIVQYLYNLLDLKSKSVIYSRDVHFFEDKTIKDTLPNLPVYVDEGIDANDSDSDNGEVNVTGKSRRTYAALFTSCSSRL